VQKAHSLLWAWQLFTLLRLHRHSFSVLVLAWLHCWSAPRC
jgi:hypothetical protein